MAIQNIYKDTTAAVMVNGEISDWFPDPLAGFFIQDIPTNVKIRLIIRLSRIITKITNSAEDLTNSASG